MQTIIIAIVIVVSALILGKLAHKGMIKLHTWVEDEFIK